MRLLARGCFRLLPLVGALVDVSDDEVSSMLSAFGAFYLILFAHYLLVPLRDEAGIALGTNLLPAIFMCSLVAALAAAPITSFFLARPGVSRAQGMKQLYFAMACVLGCFYLGYTVMHQESSHELSVSVSQIIWRGSKTVLADVQEKPSSSASDAVINKSSQDASQGESTWDAVRQGDPSLAMPVRWLYFFFFLWIGVQSLASMSALWARCSDIFSRDAALRLYGFIGGGATLGQLSGSFVARAVSHLQFRSQTSSPPFVLILFAAVAMLLASRVSQGLHPSGSLVSCDSSKSTVIMDGSLATRLWEGLRLIWVSRYLTHLCLYLVLTYCTASLFYFERSLVVARAVEEPNARTAWFATMNMYSSAIVACIQLTSTGRLLKAFGMPLSLSTTPVLAGLGLVGIALSPTPNAVLGAEVLRKVVTYAIARPAREGLFTVVSTEEKYKAKICIDTIVQRLGDTMGAGFFQIIQGNLGLGPRSLACMGVIACCCWCTLAFTLGQRNQALALEQGGAHEAKS